MFTSEQPKIFKLRSCHKVCDAYHYLLDNIFVGIGQNCINKSYVLLWVLIVLLLLHISFCFVMRETSCCLFLTNLADVVEAFNSASRYQDALPNIDNPNFEQIVSQIYPTELQLNKAYSY